MGNFNTLYVQEDKKAETNPSAGGECLDLWKCFKSFLGLSGGSIFYCLSAMAIVYGIMEIMGPLLAESKSISEALVCVLTLNVYEIVLISILLFIVLWAKVNNDAISLVVISGLFLIGSGIALGTVSFLDTNLCLYLGLGAVALGVLKVVLLKRYILSRIVPLAFVGLMVILLWNFLMPVFMSKGFDTSSMSADSVRFQWQIGWCVLFFGVLLNLFGVVSCKTIERQSKLAFLKTDSMVWLFCLIIIATASVHQYGIAYMFSVEHKGGDYLPILGLAVIFVCEALKINKKEVEVFKICLSILPLLYAIVCLAVGGFVLRQDSRFDLFWHPVLSLAVIGLLFLVFSIYHKSSWQGFVALAYGLSLLMTIGYNPSKVNLNIELFGAALVITMFALGVFYKNMNLCFIAVLIASFGILQTKYLDIWSNNLHISRAGLFAGILGSGVFAMGFIFGKKLPKLVVALGSVTFALAIFDYVYHAKVLALVLAFMMIMAVSICFWIRTRNSLAILLLWIPLFYRVYVSGKDLAHWRFIILSFVLLFVGGAVSTYKGIRSKNAEAVSTIEDSQ